MFGYQYPACPCVIDLKRAMGVEYEAAVKPGHRKSHLLTRMTRRIVVALSRIHAPPRPELRKS